jgi:peptidyl-prolyl cis-trans isomerase SurA
MLPRLRKEAKDQLIEERLKLQEAKKLGIELSGDDVNRLLKMVADQNKLTIEQLGKNLKGMGIDIATMGERFKAREAWALFVRRRYGAQVSVTLGDVDHFLAANAAEAGADTVELQLHKITLGLSGRADQSAWARRFAEAEGLQRRYKGCTAMDQLARGVPEARFQDMKHVALGRIAEPIRSMLASAKDGDVLPPFITDAGVELYAVCGRRATVGDEEQRAKARAELQSQELAKLARRHLRNVKQDAVIEDRQK